MLNVLSLHGFQEKILSDAEALYASGKNEFVMAGCPGFGKMFTIGGYIQKNPNLNFFVSAYAENGILDQWEEFFKVYGIKASKNLGVEKITFGIPQNFTRKDYSKLKGKIDVLVIDEAHYRTFAKSLQDFIAAVKPKKIIYLTGTPSRFIKESRIPILVVSAKELYSLGMLSNVYFGLASSNVDLLESDYNGKTENVNRYGARKMEHAVKADLDSLLQEMVRRLTGVFKDSPNVRKNLPTFIGWTSVIDELEKTIFACASIGQAEKVYRYFCKKKISVALSHSKNDPDSKEITEFKKTENTTKILVVVDRGRLGQNMPTLCNFVDMTGTKDIDLIYQMYARVLRLHPEGRSKKKFFFKVIAETMMPVMRYRMTAAIYLMWPDFISKYSGNVKKTTIPVKKVKRPKNPVRTEKQTDLQDPDGFDPIDDFFQANVPINGIMIDLENKIQTPLNEYCYAEMGTIMEKEFEEMWRRDWSNYSVEELISIYKNASANNEVRHVE